MRIIRVLLTAAFGWALLKNVELLARDDSLDLLLFDSAGLTWLFYLLLLGLAVCQVASLWWFWKPFSGGHLFALGAIGLNQMETILGCAIGARNTEVAKQAFITSRESRGLSVRPEVLQMMDSPYAHFAPLAVSVPLAVVWCVLVVLLVRANGGVPATAT